MMIDAYQKLFLINQTQIIILFEVFAEVLPLIFLRVY